MKHTPGPWTTRGHRHVVAEQGEKTCFIALDIGPSWPYVFRLPSQEGKSHVDSCREAEANARLIAAAPSMYQFIFDLAQSGNTGAGNLLNALDLL